MKLLGLSRADCARADDDHGSDEDGDPGSLVAHDVRGKKTVKPDTTDTSVVSALRRTYASASWGFSSAPFVVTTVLDGVDHAMTANSPFIEGRVSSRKSERGDVWLHMDPARSGLIPALQAGQCDAIISGLYDKPARRESTRTPTPTIRG
jgi:hypothetical protein